MKYTILALASIGAFSSCTPHSYIVDTTPYVDQIASNPDQVIISPEDVTEVGGFQSEFGATVRTDQGDIDISDQGISGNVIIDLRSGK